MTKIEEKTQKPIKHVCKCGKVIYGYTERQTDYMMRQHRLAKHEMEEKAD